MRGARFAMLMLVGATGAGWCGVGIATAQEKKEDKNYQYLFESISVPAATADEPKLEKLDLKAALDYLENGSLAWNASRKCVTCHTNGSYMVTRPALTPKLGKPNEEMRKHFVTSLQQFVAKEKEAQQASVGPAQSIYLAAGLAEWDAHVTKQLSPETEQALAVMFSLQNENGTWGAVDCWPPFESSAYQEATVAAMAVGTAPGWLANLKDEKLKAGVENLKKYLLTTPPRQDYDRTLLLWSAARLPGLIDEAKKKELTEIIFKNQRPDGGWSIRTFGAPDQWGNGGRAEKLKGEPEFKDPPSDGHQTGLAIILLRESGIPANDPRIQKGVQWLKTNQRASGRWWTRSLNTDRWHFVTYSGTCYPLLALSLCDALPPSVTKTSAVGTSAIGK